LPQRAGRSSVLNARRFVLPHEGQDVSAPRSSILLDPTPPFYADA
jgi:hypothetical protein